MSKIQSVSLPHIEDVQVVIKTKREVRSHPFYGQLDDESNEWFYWNKVWHSEVALSEFLIHEFYPDKLSGKTIIELGCGTGLAGLVCAKLRGIPTFSDKVPMVMESVKEACQVNEILEFQTLILDWSNPNGLQGTYDLVLGSEIFYDSAFLDDICCLLEQALSIGGRGLFCDPNRLGIEALEASFSKHFTLSVTPVTVNWPQSNSRKGYGKTVFLYEFVKKPKAG